MLASIKGKRLLADVLLKHGADPNLRDEKSGRTALFHAVENDCDYIINLLLKYKADPKLNNFLGVCPIDAARDLQTSVKDLLPEDSMENSHLTFKDKLASKRKHRQKKIETNKKLKMTFITSLKKVDPYMSSQMNSKNGDAPAFSSDKKNKVKRI